MNEKMIQTTSTRHSAINQHIDCEDIHDEDIYDDLTFDDEPIIETPNIEKVLPVIEPIVVNPMTRKDLDAALVVYRKRGWVCMPLSNKDKKKEGKSPMLRDWNKFNTETPIENSVWDNCFNVGIICGKASKICVVDTDVLQPNEIGEKHCGVEMMKRLRAKHDKENDLDFCPTARTPKGGNHYVFKYDESVKHLTNSAGKIEYKGLPVGIDFRTNSGQIVAWPSVNLQNGRKYEWIDNFNTEPPVMPEWLIELLTNCILEDNLDIGFNPVANGFKPYNPKIQNMDEEDDKVGPSELTRRHCSNTSSFYLRDLMQLLPKIEWEDREKWLANSCVIKNFFHKRDDTGYAAFVYFSKISNRYEETSCLSTWNSLRDDGIGLGINSIEEKLKESTDEKIVEAYKELRKKYYPREQIIHDASMPKCLISADDPYVWDEFYSEFHTKVFNTYDEMKSTMFPNIRRVFAKLTSGSGVVIKKDDCDSGLFTAMKVTKGTNYTDMYMKYGQATTSPSGNTISKNVKISFNDMIVDNALELGVYGSMVCEPLPNSKNKFNIWQGYKARLVEKIDMTKVEFWLNYIKDIWCNGDEAIYKYLITWLHHMIMIPEDKTKVGLFVYSKEQGTGKNTLTDFIGQYILGRHVVTETFGLERITGKFNDPLAGKKLIVVNETSSASKSSFHTWNAMKNFLTDEMFEIESKNKNPINLKNLTNWIIFSNHPDALKLDASDRRYLCLEVSASRQNDITFFEDLRKNHMNQDSANHLYTWFAGLSEEVFVKLYPVPMTLLKRNIIDTSKSPIVRFLEQKIEDHIEINPKLKDTKLSEWNEYKVVGSELYAKYKSWCESNGEKILASNIFGSQAKNLMTWKKDGSIVYFLNTLKF